MKLEEQIRQAIRDVKDYPKPGIIFKDITPVLAQPYLVKDIIANIVERYKGERIDAIAAVEARGFILGSILATELNCAFVPIRKSGKLPFRTLSQDYALEYGSASVEMHEDAVKAGWRVMVHDDLLATGGTAGAAAPAASRTRRAVRPAAYWGRAARAVPSRRRAARRAPATRRPVARLRLWAALPVLLRWAA
jgi:adenine phosphoribosyltransferase